MQARSTFDGHTTHSVCATSRATFRRPAPPRFFLCGVSSAYCWPRRRGRGWNEAGFCRAPHSRPLKDRRSRSTRRAGARKPQSMSFSVLVLHGPNLSLLAADEIDPRLKRRASELGVELICVQSNGEQGLLDALHEEGEAVDAVLVNPGALAPIAFALAEGLQQVGLPVIEVLLKPLSPDRGPSSLTGVAKQQVHGLGVDGYVKALELLVPEGTQAASADEEEAEEDETPSHARATAPQAPRGKSIGRKVATPAAAQAPGKTIGRGAREKKTVAPSLPTTTLTRTQVRDRIKKRLKGEETADSLAQWARQTWTGLQRGAACEAGAKETIENVLLTLMAGAKASDQVLVAQMAKLDP